MGRNHRKQGSQSTDLVIPEKSWLGHPGHHYWTWKALNRARRMNPKPSLLLCITSCRFRDPGRSIQLVGLWAHPVPQRSQKQTGSIWLFSSLAGRQNPAFPETHTMAVSQTCFGGHEVPTVHSMVKMVFAVIKLIDYWGRESLIK